MALSRRIEHSGALVDGPGHRISSCSPSPPPPPYSLCNAFSPKAVPRRLLAAGSCKLSIGDFLGAVSLLHDLIDEIQNDGGSSREQVELITELRQLESAILQVEAHCSDITTPAQRVALDQAAHACQYLINNFLMTIRKRQGRVGLNDNSNIEGDRHTDLRWDLATAEDIEAFRRRVSAHVQSIETLLITIQVSSAETARGEENSALGEIMQLSLANSSDHSLVLINDSFDTLRKALVYQGSVSRQTLANVDAVRQIMIMNNKQLLSALHQLQESLPPQVLLQQPIMFTDALNRVAPIHLEWIDSWDAFQAVLQVRFAHLGYKKVKRREFALQETTTRRDVPFTRPIAMCLLPGQKLDMSMIFQDQGERSSNTCPHCQAHCEGSTDSETTCTHCGCHFRRILQQDDHSEAIREAMSIRAIVAEETAGRPQKRKRSSESIFGDEVSPSDFKRLRLLQPRPSREQPRVRASIRPQTHSFHNIEKIDSHATLPSPRQTPPGIRSRPLTPQEEFDLLVDAANSGEASQRPDEAFGAHHKKSHKRTRSNLDREAEFIERPSLPRRLRDPRVEMFIKRVRRKVEHDAADDFNAANQERKRRLEVEVLGRDFERAYMDERDVRLDAVREAEEGLSEGTRSVRNPVRQRMNPRPEPYIATPAASIRQVTTELMASKWQLEGEAPLSQQSLNRSDQAYDKFLVTKLGNGRDTTKTTGRMDQDFLARHKSGSQQNPAEAYDLGRSEVPPPVTSRRYGEELPAGYDDLSWEWRTNLDPSGDFRHVLIKGPSMLMPTVQYTDTFESDLTLPPSPPESPPDLDLLDRSDSGEVNPDISNFNGSIIPYQGTNNSLINNSSSVSSPSLNPLDFTPGAHESILSRIETPGLNSTTGWSNPVLTATNREIYNGYIGFQPGYQDGW